MTNCFPVVFLPLLLGIPILVTRRDRIIAIGIVMATAIMILTYGIRFMPRDTATSSMSHETLRILSHNIGQDLSDYDLVDDLIQNSDADVVFLQELTGAYVNEHWPRLIDLYPYQIHGPLQGLKRVGMGLLSKHPVTQKEDFKLDPEGLVFQQRAIVNWKERSVSLYNIHTTFPWVYLRRDPWLHRVPWPVYEDAVRRREIDNLLDWVRQDSNPVLVGGDFNLNEHSEDYRKLRSLLRDSFSDSGKGFGFTWPANRTPVVNVRPAIPCVRIDYLFHSSVFRSENAQVLEKTGSDHRPILIELKYEADGVVQKREWSPAQ